MPPLKLKIIFGFMLLLLSPALMAQSPRAEWRFYNTSFKKDLNRFPGVLAFFAQLNRIVPIREGIQIDPDCKEVTNNNASILGAVDPAAGQALESTPGALYFNLYQKCIRHIFERVSEKNDVMLKNQTLILGSDFDSTALKNPWKSIGFNSLKPELQVSIISRFILFLIGPDVILEAANYTGEKNVFGQPEIKSGVDLAAFLQNQINSNFPNASLQEVYVIIAGLLRLGPGLQT